MRFKFFTIIIFLLIAFLLKAQDIPFEKSFFSKDKRDGLKEAQKNIKEGDLIYELGSSLWTRAIKHYQKAINIYLIF